MDDEVSSDQNRAVALPRARSRSCSSGLGPGHNFEVEDEHIVEEVVAVPASEYDHFGTSNEVGRVIEPS
eukprot:CAMPEP_0170505152 /NCGR_PEP_ID=MMETSP0208-20121228/50023_1 /TAXON_ID=197538 /ORGANISM="Strombidium inclinatum, Strain S3" /LENGTH=68 /DNA_ID=CAMNT_0010785829 /DNA_START=473 /DNA_END=679 /DNA_ORIENTATION=+